MSPTTATGITVASANAQGTPTYDAGRYTPERERDRDKSRTVSRESSLSRGSSVVALKSPPPGSPSPATTPKPAPVARHPAKQKLNSTPKPASTSGKGVAAGAVTKSPVSPPPAVSPLTFVPATPRAPTWPPSPLPVTPGASRPPPPASPTGDTWRRTASVSVGSGGGSSKTSTSQFFSGSVSTGSGSYRASASVGSSGTAMAPITADPAPTPSAPAPPPLAPVQVDVVKWDPAAFVGMASVKSGNPASRLTGGSVFGPGWDAGVVTKEMAPAPTVGTGVFGFEGGLLPEQPIKDRKGPPEPQVEMEMKIEAPEGAPEAAEEGARSGGEILAGEGKTGADEEPKEELENVHPEAEDVNGAIETDSTTGGLEEEARRQLRENCDKVGLFGEIFDLDLEDPLVPPAIRIQAAARGYLVRRYLRDYFDTIDGILPTPLPSAKPFAIPIDASDESNIVTPTLASIAEKSFGVQASVDRLLVPTANAGDIDPILEEVPLSASTHLAVPENASRSPRAPSPGDWDLEGLGGHARDPLNPTTAQLDPDASSTAVLVRQELSAVLPQLESRIDAAVAGLEKRVRGEAAERAAARVWAEVEASARRAVGGGVDEGLVEEAVRRAVGEARRSWDGEVGGMVAAALETAEKHWAATIAEEHKAWRAELDNLRKQVDATAHDVAAELATQFEAREETWRRERMQLRAVLEGSVAAVEAEWRQEMKEKDAVFEYEREAMAKALAASKNEVENIRDELNRERVETENLRGILEGLVAEAELEPPQLLKTLNSNLVTLNTSKEHHSAALLFDEGANTGLPAEEENVLLSETEVNSRTSDGESNTKSLLLALPSPMKHQSTVGALEDEEFSDVEYEDDFV
ncbi:hypothetical protein HDU93_007677 [Gonapodya sp. JEL0774]|nr:hypothetical protein HDU93_007677 [Gonapodya sp. JEL0774]